MRQKAGLEELVMSVCPITTLKPTKGRPNNEQNQLPSLHSKSTQRKEKAADARVEIGVNDLVQTKILHPQMR